MYFSKIFMLLPLLLSFTVTDLVLAPQVAQAGVDGHQTFKCPRPAHWRLPDGSCIPKGTKKRYGIAHYWAQNQQSARGDTDKIPEIAACKASVATKKNGTHVKNKDRRVYLECLLDALEPQGKVPDGKWGFPDRGFVAHEQAINRNKLVLTNCGIEPMKMIAGGGLTEQESVCARDVLSTCYWDLDKCLQRREISNTWLAYCEIRDSNRRDAMACLERALGGK